MPGRCWRPVPRPHLLARRADRAKGEGSHGKTFRDQPSLSFRRGTEGEVFGGHAASKGKMCVMAWHSCPGGRLHRKPSKPLCRTIATHDLPISTSLPPPRPRRDPCVVGGGAIGTADLRAAER